MRRPPGFEENLESFGRFAEPALLILVSLVDGPKHGYAITDDIEAITGVRFGPGTLYGAIARLESRGLIERLKSDDHRNPYRLTTIGEQALRVRLASLEAVARTARRRLSHA
jgi:DNA-binding PadR family transcriptional regulator